MGPITARTHIQGASCPGWLLLPRGYGLQPMKCRASSPFVSRWTVWSCHVALVLCPASPQGASWVAVLGDVFLCPTPPVGRARAMSFAVLGLVGRAYGDVFRVLPRVGHSSLITSMEIPSTQLAFFLAAPVPKVHFTSVVLNVAPPCQSRRDHCLRLPYPW